MSVGKGGVGYGVGAGPFHATGGTGSSGSGWDGDDYEEFGRHLAYAVAIIIGALILFALFVAGVTAAPAIVIAVAVLIAMEAKRRTTVIFGRILCGVGVGLSLAYAYMWAGTLGFFRPGATHLSLGGVPNDWLRLFAVAVTLPLVIAGVALFCWVDTKTIRDFSPDGTGTQKTRIGEWWEEFGRRAYYKALHDEHNLPRAQRDRIDAYRAAKGQPNPRHMYLNPDGSIPKRPKPRKNVVSKPDEASAPPTPHQTQAAAPPSSTTPAASPAEARTRPAIANTGGDTGRAASDSHPANPAQQSGERAMCRRCHAAITLAPTAVVATCPHCGFKMSASALRRGSRM